VQRAERSTFWREINFWRDRKGIHPGLVTRLRKFLPKYHIAQGLSFPSIQTHRISYSNVNTQHIRSAHKIHQHIRSAKKNKKNSPQNELGWKHLLPWHIWVLQASVTSVESWQWELSFVLNFLLIPPPHFTLQDDHSLHDDGRHPPNSVKKEILNEGRYRD